MTGSLLKLMRDVVRDSSQEIRGALRQWCLARSFPWIYSWLYFTVDAADGDAVRDGPPRIRELTWMNGVSGVSLNSDIAETLTQDQVPVYQLRRWA